MTPDDPPPWFVLAVSFTVVALIVVIAMVWR